MLSEPKSKQAVLKVKNWIKQCLKWHQDCKDSPTRPPKRVLDVGQLNNEEVTLYQTQREIGAYITLSHCWGPVELQPPRTLSSNIKELSKKIPWEQVSTTFQHAIWLTQSLGIRYLWINSLCIIQDDEIDWKEQSAEMSEVYGNSYLTIAATRAANGNEGLFNCPTDYHEIQPNIFMRIENDHSIWIEPQEGKVQKQNNPLLSRG